MDYDACYDHVASQPLNNRAISNANFLLFLSSPAPWATPLVCRVWGKTRRLFVSLDFSHMHVNGVHLLICRHVSAQTFLYVQVFWRYGRQHEGKQQAHESNRLRIVAYFLIADHLFLVWIHRIRWLAARQITEMRLGSREEPTATVNEINRPNVIFISCKVILLPVSVNLLLDC